MELYLIGIIIVVLFLLFSMIIANAWMIHRHMRLIKENNLLIRKVFFGLSRERSPKSNPEQLWDDFAGEIERHMKEYGFVLRKY